MNPAVLDRPPQSQANSPIGWYRADTITTAELTWNTTAITLTGTIGNTTATVSSATTLTVGMHFKVTDPLGEVIYIITNISGTTLTLNRMLDNTFAAATVYVGCVGSFTDLSGNNNHLLQTIGTQQPKLISSFLNGKKALYFDGTNDKMSRAFTLLQPYTIYGLFNAAIGSNQFIWDGFTSQTSARLDNSIISLQLSSGNNLRVDISAELTTQRLIAVVANGDNSFGKLNTREQYGNVGTNNPNGLTLFSRVPPNDLTFALGYCLEFVVYNVAHSQSTIEQKLTEIRGYYGF